MKAKVVCPVCGGDKSMSNPAGSASTKAAASSKKPQRGFAIQTEDRECSDCGQRFYSNSALQPELDADLIHQRRRIAAMKRGDYMIFDTKTQSINEVADAVVAKLKHKTKDQD